MSTRPDSAATRPRSRRSLAHVPRSKMTSGLDKENATTDVGAMAPSGSNTRSSGKEKKSRSKSLGPGGLDALQHSNGNRRKSTASFPLKSILKPTVPVSPVRNIPSFEETRRRTPARDASIQKANTQGNDQGREGLLIDFATPPQPAHTRDSNIDNPVDTFNATSAIRDEMAATKERDEKERRERERQTILEKREARRKSMANRRVSFAPEATLHTWNVVEIPDDATSSSASNSTREATLHTWNVVEIPDDATSSSASNSTRRASSLPKHQDQQPAPSPAKEAPSSPDDAESDFGFSPVREQDLQQMRDRSVSEGTDDSHADLSSSPFSGSSVVSEDTGVHSVEEEDGNSSASEDGFDAESTAMSMDDLTTRSSATIQSNVSSSSSSSARLNDALRQAAKEAGTQAIDDTGEISMEIADQEITGAFQPWIKKGQRQSFDWDDLSARHDQENVKPTEATSASDLPASDDMDEDEELSMDVTNVVGGILGRAAGRRQSAVSRKSLGQETNYGDQTMEMTGMVGGIAAAEFPARPCDEENEDEEMTMEFTSVVGGVLNKVQPPQQAADISMEQAGSYTPKSDRMSVEADDHSDEGMEMDMTTAVGGILPPPLETPDKAQAKKIMELETESGQLGSSPFQDSVQQAYQKSPVKSPLSLQIATVASENGSPSLTSVQPRRLSRRSSVLGASRTSEVDQQPQPQSPSLRPSTPSKQLTPQPRPTTPSKTPPSGNVTFRSASPKKLFRPEIKKSAEKQKISRLSIFEQDLSTGQSTPRIVLQPREGRRSSGVGIDKEGLGSPRVAALLDKRLTLGENTPQFVPQERLRVGGVHFEDPLKLQAEEERERMEEELREDGQIPPLNPTNQEPTSSLKDLISRMSPKRGKIGSRKSLHVGAARGILGKRPAELDLDDEDAENSPKRLRGHTVSPVKGVRLPAPSQDSTSRRSPLRRARSSSPLKGSTTPTQERTSVSTNGTTPLKKSLDALHLASDPKLPEEEEAVATVEDEAEDFEPIQLQDFLKMTNIHFMELTTTKRRHTTAPGSASKRLSRASSEHSAKQGVITFDDCVAAGFCTVPMLELYQHSCRELKSYISEGRQVIRSIEAETYEENPPLFREYVTAPPEIRVIMDNQFRNAKTHARLLSKATWYEWRMKLLEGLKEGLHRHVADMKADDELLSKREELLDSLVPPLVEKHAALEQEATNLQQLVEEMENCDQDELRRAREKLSSIEDEIEARKRELGELQAEVQEKAHIIEDGSETRLEYLAQIKQAERVKEECRGWSARDIRELKASVQKTEQQTGWSIQSASTLAESSGSPSLTMTYRDQLHIKFHPGAFATKNSAAEKINLPLELTYIQGKSMSLIASLVLQSLQQHLASIQQSRITPKQLLRFISGAWDLMTGLENEARMLEFCGLTRLTLSDPSDASLSLRARCTILGNAAESLTPGRKVAAAKNNTTKRIDVDFTVRIRIDTKVKDMEQIGSLDFDIDVIATKVYGFGAGNKSGLSSKEMQNILGKGMVQDEGQTLGNGVWCKAVQKLTGSAF